MNFIHQYILYYFPYCHIAELRKINKFYNSIYKPKKSSNYDLLSCKYFTGKEDNNINSIIKSAIERKRNKLIKSLSKQSNLRTIIFECAFIRQDLKIAQYMISNFRSDINTSFIPYLFTSFNVEIVKFLLDNDIYIARSTMCSLLMNRKYDAILYFANRMNNFDIFYGRSWYSSHDIETIKFLHINNFNTNWEIVARICAQSNYMKEFQYIIENLRSKINIDELIYGIKDTVDEEIITYLNYNRYPQDKFLLSNGCTIN